METQKTSTGLQVIGNGRAGSTLNPLPCDLNEFGKSLGSSSIIEPSDMLLSLFHFTLGSVDYDLMLRVRETRKTSL